MKLLPRIEWQITIVSIIALTFISWYFYNKSEKYQNEIQINELVKNSPSLSYAWLSNYKYYAFYPIDMTVTDRISNLKSTLEIRNVSDKDLEDVHFVLHFSLDPSASNAYSASKGIQLINKSYPVYKKSTAISFDIFDAFKKLGVDLKAIFPGENSAYAEMLERFKRKAGDYGPPFDLDKNIDGTPPYLPVNIRGIYVNGFIRFLSNGVRYTHVIAGTIGYGFSDPNDNKQTKGMYVQDWFFKQGLSQITFPSKTTNIIIPQHSYNGDDYIKEWNKEYGSVAFQVADKAGNYTSYFTWKKELDGLYYYNQYARSHNMKYPPY